MVAIKRQQVLSVNTDEKKISVPVSGCLNRKVRIVYQTEGVGKRGDVSVATL